MDYLKLLEEKQHFYDELSYRAVAGEKLITSMFVNLSSDLIEDINGTDARIYIEKTSMHYSECLHLASMNIADKDAADTFLSKLSSRNLISIFRQGSSSFSYEYFAKSVSGKVAPSLRGVVSSISITCMPPGSTMPARGRSMPMWPSPC